MWRACARAIPHQSPSLVDPRANWSVKDDESRSWLLPVLLTVTSPCSWSWCSARRGRRYTPWNPITIDGDADLAKQAGRAAARRDLRHRGLDIDARGAPHAIQSATPTRTSSSATTASTARRRVPVMKLGNAIASRRAELRSRATSSTTTTPSASRPSRAHPRHRRQRRP